MGSIDWCMNCCVLFFQEVLVRLSKMSKTCKILQDGCLSEIEQKDLTRNCKIFQEEFLLRLSLCKIFLSTHNNKLIINFFKNVLFIF